MTRVSFLAELWGLKFIIPKYQILKLRLHIFKILMVPNEWWQIKTSTHVTVSFHSFTNVGLKFIFSNLFSLWSLRTSFTYLFFLCFLLQEMLFKSFTHFCFWFLVFYIFISSTVNFMEISLCPVLFIETRGGGCWITWIWTSLSFFKRGLHFKFIKMCICCLFHVIFF